MDRICCLLKYFKRWIDYLNSLEYYFEKLLDLLGRMKYVMLIKVVCNIV